MKRFLLTSLMIAAVSFGINATAQEINEDVLRLEHTYYTSYYSRANHYPLMVEYTLTKKMLNCKSKAKSEYKRPVADPSLPTTSDMTEDYKLTKVYTPGYGMPVDINKCSSEGMSEAYYYTNTAPRVIGFEKDLWSKVEKKERDLAGKHRTVKVFTGNIGNSWTMGRQYKVVVPEYCWKVIYIPTTQEYKAYIFPNALPTSTTLKEYETSIDDITQRTGIRFNDGVAVTNFR